MISIPVLLVINVTGVVLFHHCRIQSVCCLLRPIITFVWECLTSNCSKINLDRFAMTLIDMLKAIVAQIPESLIWPIVSSDVILNALVNGLKVKVADHFNYILKGIRWNQIYIIYIVAQSVQGESRL